MTIGEVAGRVGIAPSAIRYYEKAGLLKAPHRTNGRRVYSAEVEHQLVVILFSKATGFTLPEIKLLLHGFPEKTTASARWKKLARGKIIEMERILARARAMKEMLESLMGCRCRKLEQCAGGFARHREWWVGDGDSARLEWPKSVRRKK
jgi:MerR family transcriptional regulator, redox-sensitive transcriptional activator SoxR